MSVPKALHACAKSFACLCQTLCMPVPKALHACAKSFACLCQKLCMPVPKALHVCAKSFACLCQKLCMPVPKALHACAKSCACLCQKLCMPVPKALRVCAKSVAFRIISDSWRHVFRTLHVGRFSWQDPQAVVEENGRRHRTGDTESHESLHWSPECICQQQPHDGRPLQTLMPQWLPLASVAHYSCCSFVCGWMTVVKKKSFGEMIWLSKQTCNGLN